MYLVEGDKIDFCIGRVTELILFGNNYYLFHRCQVQSKFILRTALKISQVSALISFFCSVLLLTIASSLGSVGSGVFVSEMIMYS